MTPLKKIVILSLAATIATACCEAQAKPFQLLKTFPIKSAGGWDYLAVSPVSNKLYVSHGSQVNILDKRTGDSLGAFQNLDGVHGIAFAPGYAKGFISNGRRNNVICFDLATDKILDSIATGNNPDAMCYDPLTKMLFAGNGRSNSETVIDPATSKAVATIALGGKPEAAVSDGQGRVYVNLEDKNEIAVIDAGALKVVKRYSVAPGNEPAGLAIDPKAHLLFAGCGNKKMVVLDAATGRQRAVLPIGDHCDGVVFDAGTGNIFASNGDGTLTIIQRAANGSYQVAGTLPTRRGARTIAVDPASHWIYLPTAEFERQPVDARERPRMIPGTFQVLVIGKK